jgi:cytochrome c
MNLQWVRLRLPHLPTTSTGHLTLALDTVALVLLLAGCAPFERAAPRASRGARAEPQPPLPNALAPTAPSAAQPTPVHLTPAPSIVGDPEAGRRLFASTGCGGCHTIAGIPAATGIAGPNLTNVALRPTLAGESIPLTPETLRRWLLEPSSVKPTASMPSVGLTPQQAQDLTAFLFSQPYNRQP